MRHVLGVALGFLLLSVVACGSSGSGGGSGGSSGSGASAGASGSSGTGGGTGDAQAPGVACTQAGGVCGCAGGCNPGFHPAPAPLLDDCPQPCDTCGACSQQCCLPDAPADAGSDGGCSGTFSCFCGTPVCVDGGWECKGSCADAG